MNPDRWRQVTDLFDAALQHDSSERAAFLDEACLSDPALREEVESLLASHNQAGGFISASAFEPTVLVDNDRSEPMEGRQVGPYVIERVLGQGGMGVVYLAEDTRLRRKVAVKALPTPFALDPQRRERLRQEARAAAALSHPGIATVYSLEEIGEDLYIVFEYVRGRTLRVELESGPLTLERSLDTAVQIARALAAAHSAGIVHRDLKPENVIRCADSSIKILDFGLARFQPTSPSGGTSATRLTGAGLILGTPAYMSPEQIDGHDADFRTDVFAFGVLTYELACGIHPFEGSTAATTAAHIVETEPVPLSQRIPGGAAELERIVRKCLRKKREERYQSTDDLVVDLEQIQRELSAPSGQPAVTPASVAAQPATVLDARWWRVHQLVVMAVYGFMTSVVWLVRKSMPGSLALGLFVALVAAAAVNGTLRAHLLFTHRFNRKALVTEMRNTAPWRSWSDWGVALLLFATAAFVAGSHVAIAALLAAVAVGCVVAFVIIEPATTRAAFPRRASGARPKAART